MPRKKISLSNEAKLPPAPARPQPITETIEFNYMPYAMSVIISRAIPEIDGLKPSHRKLLYTMYKMGLLTGQRTKSANVVGQTMKLNPHGDAAIYETMVRLTRGNATLLHPFVDSKGSFGKQYSSDMMYAASRYTEVKLDKFCEELFRGIDKNAVDFIPNYDNTMEEPVLLPTSFPNILVTPNKGIAVGMASEICPFNLGEVCDAAIQLLRHPNTPIEHMMEIIKAPDFPGGGCVIYDQAAMRQVFETGTGSVRIRSRYKYDKEANCIDVLQIPYSTTIEAIMKKITDGIKSGAYKEITDVRDEIDLNGFKMTIDLRRGTNPEKLMQKLFKTTPLEDSFKCNFNVLVGNQPRQLGIVDLLKEWIKFRVECVTRELNFDLGKKNDKLHLLLGLAKILLDIDKAIRIIRGTEDDSLVIPNLMKGFDISKLQAEYVAEIKLRNLNKNYILDRLAEIEQLEADIAEIESILKDELKLKAYIAGQLAEVKKKYGQPRRTQIMNADEIEEYVEDKSIEDYPCRLVLSREGYLKKITYQSLRGNDKNEFRENDELLQQFEAKNTDELLFFTNKGQMYRSPVNDFNTCKASAVGDYVASVLKMDTTDGEKPLWMVLVAKNMADKNMVFVFENGKGVRIPMSKYETKSPRRKLTGVCNTECPVIGAFFEDKPFDVLIVTTKDRAVTLKSTLIPVKATRSAAGVQLLTMKGGQLVRMVCRDFEGKYPHMRSSKKLSLGQTGVQLSASDFKTDPQA